MYLHALGNVQNELDIGVVVVICPTGNRHVMVCHFDVLGISCNIEIQFLIHVPSMYLTQSCNSSNS